MISTTNAIDRLTMAAVLIDEATSEQGPSWNSDIEQSRVDSLVGASVLIAGCQFTDADLEGMGKDMADAAAGICCAPDLLLEISENKSFSEASSYAEDCRAVIKWLATD